MKDNLFQEELRLRLITFKNICIIYKKKVITIKLQNILHRILILNNEKSYEELINIYTIELLLY